MIIGEHFAWGHLPKTGGDATECLFQLFPHLIVYADGPGTNDKHASFHARRDQTHGKSLALNIRRLPSWMLSYSHHKASRGLYPEYRPLAMDTAEEMAASSVADSTLSALTHNYIYPVDRWLRTEFLTQDFLVFIASFTDVSPEQLRLIQGSPRVNAMTYTHEVSTWFNSEQLAQMYANNPAWAEIEHSQYGSLHYLAR